MTLTSEPVSARNRVLVCVSVTKKRRLESRPVTPVAAGIRFELFTDSEVRHVRCEYVIHYSIVCNSMRASWRARNTEKQGEGEIYVKLV